MDIYVKISKVLTIIREVLTMSLKFNITYAIQDLQNKGIIHLNEQHIQMMKGTTDGLVYTLGEKGEPKYVLKVDTYDQISYVAQFLQTYENVSLLPKLLYTDPKKEFIVYSFIKGTTHFNRGSKVQWMTTLANELFNSYKQCDQDAEWGRLGLARPSWYEFNTVSVEVAFKNIGDLLSIDDYYVVKALIESISKEEPNQLKYLLHGDTGVHNFVFNKEEVAGVIDPAPMIGPIIYDFTYAFCSSPDDLDLETLRTSFSCLNNVPIDESRLIEEVVVQLYTRIGICARVHPQDLEQYLKAWKYWKSILKPILYSSDAF